MAITPGQTAFTRTPLPASCLLPGQQDQVTGADGLYRFDVLLGADPAEIYLSNGETLSSLAARAQEASSRNLLFAPETEHGAELQARWPAHSVPPGLMAQLDELEEALAAARRELDQDEGK